MYALLVNKRYYSCAKSACTALNYCWGKLKLIRAKWKKSLICIWNIKSFNCSSFLQCIYCVWHTPNNFPLHQVKSISLSGRATACCMLLSRSVDNKILLSAYFLCFKHSIPSLPSPSPCSLHVQTGWLTKALPCDVWRTRRARALTLSASVVCLPLNPSLPHPCHNLLPTTFVPLPPATRLALSAVGGK